MNQNGYQVANLNSVLRRIPFQRGLSFGIIIIAALLAFEIFNYSTTEYALGDLLGELNFAGVSWATILALAFCGIDFAGIARLFTPEAGNGEQHTEVWYLFGAWLLAATMNAMLTWWGVSLAVLNHQTLGNAMVERTVLLRVVPIFVAVMVWLIRVLIIGTFSVAGDRMFSIKESYLPVPPRTITAPGLSTGIRPQNNQLPAHTLGNNRIPVTPAPAAAASNTFRPAPKPARDPDGAPTGYTRQEPTYHPVSMSGSTTRNPSEGFSARNSQTRR